MRRLLYFSLLILISRVSDAQPQPGTTQEQSDLISSSIRSFPANTEFSIALVNREDVQFVGIRKKTDTSEWVTNHQQAFEIGSITKVFTSTLLADLALRGKVKLDDRFTKYLDVPVKDTTRITFTHLANHTSGLPRLPSNLIVFAVDPGNPYKNYDEGQLLEYLKDQMKVAQAPGEKYEYSNLAVGLLGYIITKIEGKTYEALLQEKILQKYKMNHTSTDRSKVQSWLVKGVNHKGEVVPNWDLNVLAAAGAMLSSAEDLSKFAIAQFDQKNKVASLTRQETFKISDASAIGLGWHLQKANGHVWFGHGGGTGGYRSAIMVDPEKKTAAIVLSNITAFYSHAKDIDKLCVDLLKTL